MGYQERDQLRGVGHGVSQIYCTAQGNSMQGYCYSRAQQGLEVAGTVQYGYERAMSAEIQS